MKENKKEINEDEVIDTKNISGDIIKEVIVANGLASKNELVKIMARGEQNASVSISADKFTKSAEELIAKAGGKAITL